MLLSPCLQWVLYAIIPSVYKIYRPPFGRDDILHITLLLRKRAICGNIVSRAGHNIQIHSGIIAHITFLLCSLLDKRGVDQTRQVAPVIATPPG